MQRDVILLTIVGAALSLPIIVMTLSLAPASVALVQRVVTKGRGLSVWQFILSDIFNTHLRLPVAIAAGAGLVASLIRRDPRILLGLAWLGAVIGSVILFTGKYDSARYAFAALPAYFLCAASLTIGIRSRLVKFGTMAILGSALVAQLWAVRHVRPTGADGYELAAQFVVDQHSSPTVLFSGPIDAGYFSYFVRKHDPSGHLVVLRSDKLLTTSTMTRVIDEHIKSAEEIYPLLRRYGTRFVVIEDRPGGRVMNWLRDEVKGDRFIQRLRVPIGTRDPRLRGVDLVVHEYKEATAPDPDARIDIRIPLVSREINVELADLIGR